MSTNGWTRSFAPALPRTSEAGWAVSPKFGEPHTATFQLKDAVQNAGGSKLAFQLIQQYPDGQHNLGKFRISVSSSASAVSGSKLPPEIAAVLKVPAAERNADQQAALMTYYKANDVELLRLKTELKQAQDQSVNARLYGVQDLAWAFINSPAFLFNR